MKKSLKFGTSLCKNWHKNNRKTADKPPKRGGKSLTTINNNKL